METALKLLLNGRQATKSMLVTAQERLEYAKFKNDEKEVLTTQGLVDNWKEKLKEYDVAISELGQGKKLKTA